MIPLADLQSQHAQLRPEIQAAIEGIFAASDFVQGQEVRRFETEFAAYCGAREAVACGNGTDALELALWGLGVGAGDEVITVSHTFAATAEAIVRCGAVPRFIDVDRGTLLMDVTRLEAAITKRTRAIIPVHLYGSCVDMASVMAIARRHGLAVIEDAAQAQGATSRGVKAGASADAGCFSFYPGKNLGACGDAGAVVTSDPGLASRMRKMRDHGRVGKYEHAFVGRNSRMDSLQGAVLRIKLRRLDRWNQRRREIAGMYRALLAGVNAISLVSVPESSQPVYHQFVIRTTERDALRRALEARGIQTGIHYPIPLHRQPAFAAYVSTMAAEAMPETEAAAASILSLPMYPELSDRDVEDVGLAIAESLEPAADVMHVPPGGGHLH
jgi:dTDP-4-amino-4,6-dideoxygalactose transaminase